MSLDNYDGLVDLREHVQNMHSSLELVIQDNDAMCKILLITFKESACAWYDNLESGSIEEFRDLWPKLVAYFKISIPIKKSSINLFGVTQSDGESIRAYLKRFDEKILKMKELIKPVALKALINRVRERAL